MPAHAKAPPRRATRTAPEEMGRSPSHKQRTRRAHYTRQVVDSSVTVCVPSRQPASHSSWEKLAQLCAAILDNNAASADLYGDACRLAIALHHENHALAPLARDVALTIIHWTSREHRAAELAALAAELAAELAGEETDPWQ